MRQISRRLKSEGKSIGFVPTMGYLHEGHLSLIKKSKKLTDVTIVSIFVNPTQFAANEDLSNYPRNLKRDKNLLSNEGVDFLFFPSVEEIYPENYQTYVEVNNITRVLEGEFRPTHFKGVTTVVSILFNSVNPDHAFFGQKDAQQAAVIERMVKDLNFDIKIHVCPIVRESDGLAMSSRNIYLSAKERSDALVLSRALNLASKMVKIGELNPAKIIIEMEKIISSVDNSKPDYVRIVNADTFEESKNLKKGEKYYFLIACRIGRTRLIDNVLLKV